MWDNTVVEDSLRMKERGQRTTSKLCGTMDNNWHSEMNWKATHIYCWHIYFYRLRQEFLYLFAERTTSKSHVWYYWIWECIPKRHLFRPKSNAKSDSVNSCMIDLLHPGCDDFCCGGGRDLCHDVHTLVHIRSVVCCLVGSSNFNIKLNSFIKLWVVETENTSSRLKLRFRQ